MWKKFTEFFKATLDSLGTDITLLLAILFVGISLSIVYNGVNDAQTATFSLIFCMLALISLLAAAASKFSGGNFFIGADSTIIEEISPKNNPVFGLIFILIGYIVGFLMSAGGALFTSLSKSQSFGPANFVFQNGFSPVVEEYFYRGFLLSLFKGIAFPIVLKSIDNENIAHGVSFLFADIIQSIAFVFVHLVAFNGNPSQMLSSFAFAMGMGIIAYIFGLLMAIGIHAGHNGGVWAITSSTPSIVNIA